MLSEDRFFQTSDEKKLWQRYCGFLDLSLEEFMEIQKHLLLEEIELVADTPLGRKLMNGNKPKSVEEFRRLVPLTTYEDYAPYIGNCQEDALAQKPHYWGHTSGKGGSFKWVPYTERADEVLCKSIMGAAILSLANKWGEVNLRPGVKVLSNLPERPYVSGCLAFSVASRFTWHNIPPLDISEKMEFQERIEKGFKMALCNKVDLVISMSSVLIKLGDSFSEGTRSMKFSLSMLHPKILLRLARAWLCSKRERRAMLPKDLWPVKAVISWGTDTAIYKDKIRHCWGKEPYEFYVFTEAGYIAEQGWNKKGMTFLANTAFLEFIPEKEWLKWREDKNYQPATVLLNEVKEGECYEIVVTNFYGMPFLRYRVGDLIKIVSLRDEETGVNLPQMVFQSKADDLIDIGSFTRLDEKTVWQAIANTQIRYTDWTIRKEYEGEESILHLYIEPNEDIGAKDVEGLVHEHLKAVDQDYNNLDNMLGIKPLRVTLLPEGAFQRYYNAKRAAGFDLAHLRPPHMNASEETIRELLELR